MKKLPIALLVFPFCSFGQLSLRPSIGAGYGMISQKGSLIKWERSGMLCQSAQLSAFYGFGNWFVSAGIGYLTTGFSYHRDTVDLTVPHQPPQYWTNVKTVHKYEHMIIPVTVGRRLSLGKLDLAADVGVDIAKNLSEKAKLTRDNGPDTDYEKNEWFETDYKPWSVFANLGVTANYRLSNRLSVFFGPSYKYMVTSIVRYETNALTGEDISQKHRAILLNAGVYLALSN